jgi:hypothetical protein
MALRREVFPEPLAPRITQCWPGDIDQETSLRMTTFPRWIERLRIERIIEKREFIRDRGRRVRAFERK